LTVVHLGLGFLQVPITALRSGRFGTCRSTIAIRSIGCLSPQARDLGVPIVTADDAVSAYDVSACR